MLVGYYHDAFGQPFYVVVVNAGNRQKIVDWVASICLGNGPNHPAAK